MDAGREAEDRVTGLRGAPAGEKKCSRTLHPRHPRGTAREMSVDGSLWTLRGRGLGCSVGFIPETFLDIVCSFESEAEYPNQNNTSKHEQRCVRMEQAGRELQKHSDYPKEPLEDNTYPQACSLRDKDLWSSRLWPGSHLSVSHTACCGSCPIPGRSSSLPAKQSTQQQHTSEINDMPSPNHEKQVCKEPDSVAL